MLYELTNQERAGDYTLVVFEEESDTEMRVSRQDFVDLYDYYEPVQDLLETEVVSKEEARQRYKTLRAEGFVKRRKPQLTTCIEQHMSTGALESYYDGDLSYDDMLDRMH